MTEFESFLSGPLLVGVFVFFILGLANRLVVSIRSGFKAEQDGILPDRPGFKNQARRLLPFHKLFIKRPLKVIFLYLFHLSLILVPILYSGHIYLWEESSLGWSWTPLPDAWSDWLTIGLLLAAAVLIFRRIVIGRLRRESAASDYLWIIIAVLPFLSGYFLAHSTPADAILGDSLWIIHVLSGELLIVMTAFLFVRIRLSEAHCNGCAACAVECPAASLVYQDEDKRRCFVYDLFKCIKCGNCVRVCPESAARAVHAISLKDIFWIGARRPIGTVALARCQGCGQPISPEQLIGIVDRGVPQMHAGLCIECKQLSLVGSVERTGRETGVFRLPDGLDEADLLESIPIFQGDKR